MTYKLPTHVEKKLVAYEEAFRSLPNQGLYFFNKVQTLVSLTSSLERIIDHPEEDPWPLLDSCLTDQLSLLKMARLLGHEISIVTQETSQYGEHDRTKPLFEAAWTTYSDDVYDHSVKLVEDRLVDSGFDREWFEGKVCFDGGCGTGRLSLAMARLGAKKVVAADFGGKSLEFFKRQLQRQGLPNVEVVEMDVTDLSPYQDESFDFVASNGVLHHTPRCLEGLDEHYRVTKTNGVMWLYLYGAGGFYWDIYDRMKKLVSDIEIAQIVRVMKEFHLREGFIYTFLDNVFAARTYYLESDIIERLSKISPLQFDHQGGPAIFDNPGKYIKENYGKDIMGPQGEVRVVIHKRVATTQRVAV